MTRPAFFLSVVFAFGLLHVADSQGEKTVTGCICVDRCARTIEYIQSPWCNTSPVNPPANYTGCGKWSASRSRFWDECVPNITTTDDAVLLKTFPAVWTTITVSACGTSLAGFFLMGCIASLCMPTKMTFFWLPLTTALIGTCHTFIVAAIFSTIIAFLYLSMPYALTAYVGASIGFTLSALLMYNSLGRQHTPMRPPHPSEFTE